MPRIGQLNRRVKIQSSTNVGRDSRSGEVTKSSTVWSDVTTVWAKRRDRSTLSVGGESMESLQPRSQRVTIWTIRHTTKINTEHRLVDAVSTGQVFDVESYSDPDGRRRWLEVRSVRRDL